MSRLLQRPILLAGTIVMLLGAAGYGLFETRDLIAGPVIVIEKPENGAVFSDSLIEINGTARNITSISFNGRQIFVDEEGRFSETLLLSYGYNIMTLSAEDKFGRTVSKTLEAVYK